MTGCGSSRARSRTGGVNPLVDAVTRARSRLSDFGRVSVRIEGGRNLAAISRVDGRVTCVLTVLSG